MSMIKARCVMISWYLRTCLLVRWIDAFAAQQLDDTRGSTMAAIDKSAASFVKFSDDEQLHRRLIRRDNHGIDFASTQKRTARTNISAAYGYPPKTSAKEFELLSKSEVLRHKEEPGGFGAYLIPPMEGWSDAVGLDAPMFAQTWPQQISERSKMECEFDTSEWKAYAELHKAGRDALIAGDRKRPVLIWHCDAGETLCGGKGDNLKGMVSAFVIAAATKRVLFFIWKRGATDMLSYLEPNSIDWRVPKEMGSDYLAQCAHVDKIDETINHMSDEFKARPEACIYLKTNDNPEKSDFFRRPGCIMNFLWKPSATSADMLSDILSKTGRGVMEYVAVHLRYGDQAMKRGGSADKRMDETRTDLLVQFFSCAQKLGRPDLPTIVVTDSNVVKDFLSRKDKMKGEFGKDADKIEQSPIGNPSHSDSPGVSQDGIHGMWSDHLLLAGATGLVRTYGGFATSAGEFGLVPRDQMLDLNMQEDVSRSSCVASHDLWLISR